MKFIWIGALVLIVVAPIVGALTILGFLGRAASDGDDPTDVGLDVIYDALDYVDVD